MDYEKRILDAVSAEGTEWQAGAPCVTADFDFVPDIETDEGVNEAQQWCRTCPVRTRCLAWAMLHRAEGYWGGTTTYQRDQLRRVRTRAKCPLCLGTALVYEDPHELCLACGISWIRDVREEPIAATALHVTYRRVTNVQIETERLQRWAHDAIDQMKRRHQG